MPATRPSRPSRPPVLAWAWVAGAVVLACTTETLVPVCDLPCFEEPGDQAMVERERAREHRWSCGCGWCVYHRIRGGTAEDCASFEDVREEWLDEPDSRFSPRLCVYCAGVDCRPRPDVPCDGSRIESGGFEYVCSYDRDDLRRFCGPAPSPPL